jgi:hypothetical protein
MITPIIDRDLTKEAPHSPRDRLAGFAIASRAVDKCRASLAGTIGAYHYDGPLDNMLFRFKGITSAQFKAAVQASKSYEDVGDWLLTHGIIKTPEEINIWSNKMEFFEAEKNPIMHAHLIESFGLNPETNTLFDWLEADDRGTV